MSVITVANTKGGAGKSTSAVFLATAAARTGRQVRVLDADPQGTASEWAWAAEEDGTALPFTVEPVNSAGLRHLHVTDDLTIVDTPPGESSLVQAAIDLSDFVVIPTKATSADLWRTAATVAAVAGRLSGVLITQARTGTTLLNEVKTQLDKDDVSYFDTVIPLREAIASAVGTVPTELWGYEIVLDEIMKEI
ncbi:ParA family protein [Acidipropionibacterium jensenii]|uniref:ParA family protein n=1 Tax=Acidipropionibacterium jensenii TaxID=1749 RepID=UPI000BC327B3|nr:ParA family protein [Acidipropionibacterium jensenii]